MAAYTLPDLPHDYTAFEPYVSGTIMELHHDKHHANYVGGANAALEKPEAARESDDFAAINPYEKNPALDLGDHTNHTIFWQNMTPDAQERPEGELAVAIDEYLGSFEKFQGQLVAVALGLQGSGWGVLAWGVLSKRLVTFRLIDQQGNIPVVTVPFLMFDTWEHVFYLDYQNVKTDYVKVWWNIVNWADVAVHFECARTQYAGLVFV